MRHTGRVPRPRNLLVAGKSRNAIPGITASYPLLAAATAALAVAVLLLAGVASSRAAAPTVSNETLTWSFASRATVTIVPRGPADCGGGRFGCVEVRAPDQPAQRSSGRCASRNARHLAIRCSTVGAYTVAVRASGGQPVSMRMDRAAGAPCPNLGLHLQERSGNGAVAAADGCQQRISCGQSYAGHVDADSQDVVDASCKDVSIDGGPNRNPDAEPPCTTPYHGCAPDTGGGGRNGGVTGNDPPKHERNPISSVRVTRAGRTTLRSTILLATDAWVTIELYRRTSRGTWTLAQSVERAVRKGTDRVPLRRPKGRAFAAGTYRVTATADVVGVGRITSGAVTVRR